MNKQEIVRTFRSITGAVFITRKQLADLMGMKDPHGVDRYLKGLERIDNKYYFIPDVAEVLISRRRSL